LDDIGGLSPKSDVQNALKPQAMGLLMNLAQIRWLTFVGFGLFASWNATTVVALALCAMAVSGAVVVMLEMYTPFTGFMQISSAPLREALAHLGR
jgi:hypothetical protein